MITKNIRGGFQRNGKAVTRGRMTDLGIEWSAGPDLIIARNRHRSVAIGNKVFHIGGTGLV